MKKERPGMVVRRFQAAFYIDIWGEGHKAGVVGHP